MKKLLIFLCCATAMASVKAQNEDDNFRALYIYNFTNFIEWPASSRTGDFHIKVLGDSPVIQAFQNDPVLKAKRVGQQAILVSKAASVADLGTCHIIYIPPDQAKNIDAIVQALKGKPTLIITASKGMANLGAGINILTPDKDGVEINRKNIETHSLIVANKLMEFGTLIE